MLQHIRLSQMPLAGEASEHPRVLSLLLDKTDERVYLINTNFELMYFNRIAAQELQSLTGRKVKVGENLLAALPPAMLETHGVLYRQSLEKHHAAIMSGRSITGESKYRTRRGEEHWIKMRISPLQVPTGEVVAIAVMVKDITRRKMAETRRDEYLQNLQNILETMLDVVVAVDELQTIVTFNRAAENAFGHSAAEVLGLPLSTLFPEHYIDLVTNFSSSEFTSAFTAHEGLSASEKKHHAQPYPVKGRNKNGLDMPMEATVSSSLYEGRFFLTIIARDITERLEMEQKIRTTNKVLEQKVLDRTESLYQVNAALHKLNEEKNDIINLVSHDLKNPIGTIQGFAEMLALDYSDDDQLRLIAHHIMRTSTQMFELVNNLLSLNAIESGATTIHPVTVNVAPILQALSEIYATSAARKDIKIEMHIPKPCICAHADEIAVHQVLENLLSNAVKYSPIGGTVRIHVFSVNGRNLPHIEQDVRCTGLPLSRAVTPNSVLIAVQDEGEGVQPQDMPFLFTKFRKLSAQPTGGETSSGLGLSIVKRQMESMNGRVWCESEAGKGATFFVEFPIAANTVPMDYVLAPKFKNYAVS
jgi:PAS domain S-box-containing protein